MTFLLFDWWVEPGKDTERGRRFSLVFEK